MDICCDEFAKACGQFNDSYRAMLTLNKPKGQIEYNDGEWFVLGCCGDCYVIPLRYCPFCGAKLPS